MHKSCEECGEDFEPKSKVSRFCSDRCRYKARDRKRMVPCSICAEPMHAGRTVKKDGTAAHNKCRTKDHGAPRYDKGCRCQVCKDGASERQREYTSRVGYYSRPEVKARLKNRTRPSYDKVCPECNAPFTTQHAHTQLCSALCGTRRSARKAAEARAQRSQVVLYTGAPYTPPVTHIKTSHRLVSGACRTCGDWFVSEYRDVTCSPECAAVERKASKDRHKAKRRALKRDAYVADVYRLKVYEADGYRCHLCGHMTDKTKQVPHPKAPTLDHIIPLAVGGTHEPLNCRTAHFECNSRKSYRGEGEQLLLIAY